MTTREAPSARTSATLCAMSSRACSSCPAMRRGKPQHHSAGPGGEVHAALAENARETLGMV